MSNFDAFGQEAVALPEDIHFGEVVILRGYQGIRVPGEKGIQEYQSDNPAHQALIADGKKVHVTYEFQHFPIGANFDTYPMQVYIWSDEWKVFEASAGRLWGLNPDDKNERTQLYANLKELTSGGHYFSYETPITRTYTKQDGGNGNVRSVSLVAEFATLQECEAAYEANKGSQPLPADDVPDTPPPVGTLPLEQAIGFVDALARQNIGADNKVDCDALQLAMDALPMLGGLLVTDPQVVAKIAEVEANPPF